MLDSVDLKKVKQLLNKLEKIKQENKKLEKIIKENFSYSEFCKKCHFKWNTPVMDKEIQEVLNNGK